MDVVVMMAELYNAPELKCLYCKEECPIGKYLPVATEQQTLEAATIHLLDSLNPTQIELYSQRLICIAADGVISDEEQKELEPILAALNKASEAISELRNLMEKHKNERGRSMWN